jgi:Domain of unknown function (DUF4157)
MSTTATPGPSTTDSKGSPSRASAVRAPLLQRACSCAGGGGECETCKKKPPGAATLQRAAAGLGPAPAATAPPVVNRVLNSPGRPLDSGARSFMEPRFGRDFGGVRVHTDQQAAESARAVDAHAYTVGQHIVFDSGKYDPHSGSGQKLLAHELAHTVQQRNVQHTPEVLPLRETPEYNYLENEAESIAQSVMHRGASFNPPAAPRPVLSRATKPGTPTTPPAPAGPGAATNKPAAPATPTATAVSSPPLAGTKRDGSVWQPVAPGSALAGVGVKTWALPQNQTDVIAVEMKDAFNLPPEKGSGAIDVWKKQAKGAIPGALALEAIVEVAGGKVKSGQKQDTADTDTKRKLWFQKVRWAAGDADKNWATALQGLKKPVKSFPETDTGVCDLDHIVELQFGGVNVPENMQVLDLSENRSSGSTIRHQLAETAALVNQAVKSDKLATGTITDVIIRYSDVTQSSVKCKTCCDVEKAAANLGTLKAGESIKAGVTAGAVEPFKAGGVKVDVLLKDAKQNPVPLADSTEFPENKAASTLISGLSLTKWKRPKSGSGTVEAIVGLDDRFPKSLHVDQGKTTELNRAADGTLTLPAGHKLKSVPFHFDYLSPGVFNELKIEDDKYLVGSGTITPEHLLPKFDVRFDREKLELAKEIPKDKLKLPIPGLKINKAEVKMQLAPEFKPAGEVEFSLDAGKRHLLDGKIELSGDEGGLVAQGDVQVSLPGVDNAAGNIEYRNKQWSGKAEISATQLKQKLKYVESGSLIVMFSDHGMTADGKVLLNLPGTKGVEAELIYHSSSKRWIFRGKGIFKPPGLEETTISIMYDGEHLDGEGKTGFTFHGIHGDISVVYHDERFSGEGKLTINKGKAKGSLHVKMREQGGHPVFSGDGEISYEIKEGLIATAGIEINEKQEVRLKGALEFPKPIHLFDAVGNDYTIFEVGVSIPIPGASIGPLGLKARIDGSLSAGYQIGPGELRNTKIEAAFNPLEDNPDPEITLTSTLHIGGGVHITGSIEGKIELDALIASVGGGLTITARASLDGALDSSVTLHYKQGRFEADADFKILLALALTLALKAFVEAEAGVWKFKIRTRKDWTLKEFHYDTGLQFGMKLKKPIHYVSDQPTQLPSLSDIEWIKPDIHPVDALEKIFSGAGDPPEREV